MYMSMLSLCVYYNLYGLYDLKGNSNNRIRVIKTCLIRNPEISEADIKERRQNDSAQNTQHPESCFVLEGLGRVQKKCRHDDHQCQRVIVGLRKVTVITRSCFLLARSS